MVVALPLPQACSIALVSAVVEDRLRGINAAYFAGLEPEWRARVQQYLNECGNPETIPDWPEVARHGAKFVNLYDSPQEGHAQHGILAGLRERSLQYCPSCGEAGAPNTLDHYLPKTDFPHFSITPANLTPMCDRCQGVKLANTVDDEGQRIYLHPYFDDFLVERVLDLVIVPPYWAPIDFSLFPNLELDGPHVALVQRHINGLKLEERYGHYFRDQYMRLLHLVSNMRLTEQDVRTTIGAFVTMEQRHPPNTWANIFWKAVSTDEDLLTYLEDGELPDHV